ncbi:MAG: UPF0182 family protein [Acidimicrobiales bacterium]
MKAFRTNVRSSRFRTPILIGVAVLVVLLLSASGLARAYTDWLWFDSLSIGQVWTTVVGTQFLLAAIFTILFFVILQGNLLLADRLAPAHRVVTPEEDLVERYHELVGSQGGKLRQIIAAVFALVAGANTASQWQEWLLFRNGGDVGWQDPLFARDAGFYMFRLPFISFVVDWLFASLILTLIVVVVAHYLSGGIRASAPTDRVTSGVKLHLSLLLAALAVVRAAGYYLDRFGLVTSHRGIRDGALATAVNIQLPAYNLLTLVALFGAVLFIINIRRQGWGLPMVAIGLWAVSHLVVGNLFPTLYERLRVAPQASTREAEYVGDNINATRYAFGLDESRLAVEDFPYQEGLTRTEVASYSDVLQNVPLLDPSLARDSFIRSQGERAIYEFSDPLDVDRYNVNGTPRPMVLSARGLNIDEVGSGWERQHIVFTHGYGATMAAGWTVDSTGRPDFLVSGLGDPVINPELTTTLTQPRVYFGENFDGYAIVDAGRDEVDYQTSANESVFYRYDGDGGVSMGSVVRRTAFALRFRHLDPLIAPAVTSDSQVIYIRDVAERVRTAAPFLEFDSDPYPVMVNGGISWVVDAYTTSSRFPYSQQVETSMAGTDLAAGYNYVRNSVKVVVDAYTGATTFYVVDDTDPVLAAWRASFPDVFTDGAEMPEELRAHLRYPEDLFRAQTDMWATYVVSDPVQLIQGDVAWSVAAQPRNEAQVTEADTTAAGQSTPMDPQYLITRLPDFDNDPTTGNAPEFVLQRAFVPRSGEAGSNTERPELTGIMMARSDPGNYGELVLYRIPSGEVEAPDFVHSEIRKNDALTEFVKEKIGSVVLFGEMTLLLVDDTIVYIRPVYVEAASRTAVPELSRVIAVNGSRIAMGETLDEAIAAVVDESAVPPPAAETEPATPEETPPATDSTTTTPPAPPADGTTPPTYDPSGRSVAQLVEDASDLLAAADVAEAQGRAEDAAELRRQAQAALTTMESLLGTGDPTPPVGSTVPTSGT